MLTMSRIVLMLHGALLVILSYVPLSSSTCNEAVCASIVSKCMLTQSCKCDLKNCTCCRDCYNCLDDLYYECCSCVEMCPKSSEKAGNLSQSSHVGDLSGKIPELFNALTEEQDSTKRWYAHTFPAYEDVPFLQHGVKLITVSPSQDIGKMEDDAINCTVAFMSQCTSWNKCKKSCTSMGASSYRWFHDGCCECVGDTCINYGKNTSMCLECPSETDEEGEDSDLFDDEFSEVESNETRDTDTDETSSNNADKNDAKKQTKEQADAKDTYHKEVTENHAKD